MNQPPVDGPIPDDLPGDLPEDLPVELEDARLRQALAHAPDHNATPDWRLRKSILEKAHVAVSAHVPRPAIYSPRKPWWQRIFSGGSGSRMPWNAAFATVLVAGLVTVLWQREPVPGARLDGDARVRPPSTASGSPARPAAEAPASTSRSDSASSESAAPAAPPAPASPVGQATPPTPSATTPRAAAPTPGVSMSPPPRATTPVPGSARAGRPGEAEYERASKAATSAPPAGEPLADEANNLVLLPDRLKAEESRESGRSLNTLVLPSRPAPPSTSMEADAGTRPMSPPSSQNSGFGALRKEAPADDRNQAEPSARRRASIADAPPPSPGQAGSGGASSVARPAGKAAPTAAMEPPSFAALSQWNRITISRAGGLTRSLRRAETGNLNALLGSAALSSASARPLGETPDWRITLERDGDVLAVFEVAASRVRWREGQSPAVTGVPSGATLVALRKALIDAVYVAPPAGGAPPQR